MIYLIISRLTADDPDKTTRDQSHATGDDGGKCEVRLDQMGCAAHLIFILVRNVRILAMLDSENSPPKNVREQYPHVVHNNFPTNCTQKN